MSGTSAAKQIRCIAPNIKIIFLSMHEPESLEEVGKRDRVDACLSKFCSPELLAKTIKRVLGLTD